MLPNAALDVHDDWPSTWTAADMVNGLRAEYARGVRLLIIKASESTGTYGNAARWVQAAQAAGLQCALYHFLHAGNIDAQVNTFVGVARALNLPKIRADLFIPRYWTDWEQEDKSATGGQQLTPPSAAEVAEFQAKSGAALGEQMGTYRSAHGNVSSGASDAALAKGPLWVAQYTNANAPSVPAPWKSWLLWQRTGGWDDAYPQGNPPGGLYYGALVINGQRIGDNHGCIDASHYAGNRIGGWGLSMKGLVAAVGGVLGFAVGGPPGAVAGAAAAGLLVPKFMNA